MQKFGISSRIEDTPYGTLVLDHSVLLYGSSSATDQHNSVHCRSAAGGLRRLKGGRHLGFPKTAMSICCWDAQTLGVRLDAFGDSPGCSLLVVW